MGQVFRSACCTPGRCNLVWGITRVPVAPWKRDSHDVELAACGTVSFMVTVANASFLCLIRLLA